MAWISVHDHVVGGKLRELAKDIGCSQKEALGILVSLWLWGLNNADQTGKLRSCDKSDVAEAVFSNGLSEGLDKMEIVETAKEDRDKLWDNKSVWDALNDKGCQIMNGLDVIEYTLKSGEKDKIIEAIDKLSGYDSNNLEEVAKNS